VSDVFLCTRAPPPTAYVFTLSRMAHLFRYPNNTGLVADITYSNIVLVNAGIAILIDGG
jgi:hypothetical protein